MSEDPLSEELDNRRPIKSRSAGWAQGGAAALARMGVSPDMVSAGAVGFAVIGGGAFLASGLTSGMACGACLVLGAACVQLRLVCNLLDGLVAVEHKRGGPYGAIWNELPDRIADALFLIGAGYGAALAGAPKDALWAEPVGWLAAVLAVLTAYIRELGRGLGFAADFSGPGAKPQRMAVLTAAAVIAAFEGLWGWRGETLAFGLALIAALAAVTSVRRTLRLGANLKARRPALH